MQLILKQVQINKTVFHAECKQVYKKCKRSNFVKRRRVFGRKFDRITQLIFLSCSCMFYSWENMLRAPCVLKLVFGTIVELKFARRVSQVEYSVPSRIKPTTVRHEQVEQNYAWYAQLLRGVGPCIVKQRRKKSSTEQNNKVFILFFFF